MLSWLLRLLLYPSPKIRFRDDEIAQYEQWASMMQENRLIADDNRIYSYGIDSENHLREGEWF
jgi:hypothetical protein